MRLKFKYRSKTAIASFVEDIKFCGGVVKEKTVLPSENLVYIDVEEPQSGGFMRKFKDTRSGNFLLN